MPIDPKLLDILRCPVTKQSLFILTAEQIARINAQISDGELHYADGSLVEATLEEGLITKNGGYVYRIDDDIAVMLQDMSIPMSEVEQN